MANSPRAATSPPPTKVPAGPRFGRLAFTSWRDGNPEIYVINLAGGNPVRLTTNEVNDWLPDWTPDGRHLVFDGLMEENPDDHYRESYDVIDIDGARVLFEDGWALIRASNTQPVIVCRFEADTPEALRRIRDDVAGWLADQGVTVPDLD